MVEFIDFEEKLLLFLLELVFDVDVGDASVLGDDFPLHLVDFPELLLLLPVLVVLPDYQVEHLFFNLLDVLLLNLKDHILGIVLYLVKEVEDIHNEGLDTFFSICVLLLELKVLAQDGRKLEPYFPLLVIHVHLQGKARILYPVGLEGFVVGSAPFRLDVMQHIVRDQAPQFFLIVEVEGDHGNAPREGRKIISGLL